MENKKTRLRPNRVVEILIFGRFMRINGEIFLRNFREFLRNFGEIGSLMEEELPSILDQPRYQGLGPQRSDLTSDLKFMAQTNYICYHVCFGCFVLL